MIPEDLRYTAEHEWVAGGDGGAVRVGITHFAQDALGDIVFVQLPDEGAVVAASSPIMLVDGPTLTGREEIERRAAALGHGPADRIAKMAMRRAQLV